MLNSYLELNFDVLHAATNNRYADGDKITLVKLGLIALFSIYKLTTSSRKLLENKNHAHIVCLMYELLSSSRGSDDLSIGFERSRDKRQRKMTDTKNIKGKYHVRIYLKEIFGFAEYQKTATFGLGYNVTLTRNTDNAVLNKNSATNNGKIKINYLERYVPHYTPSLEEYNK